MNPMGFINKVISKPFVNGNHLSPVLKKHSVSPWVKINLAQRACSTAIQPEAMSLCSHYDTDVGLCRGEEEVALIWL